MMGQEIRIGVISDTHVRELTELPEPIMKALARVDLIVHAGDFTEKAVLDGLRKLSEVKAVQGNMDSDELRRILPRRDLFEVGGRKVGLVHGSGVPWGLAERVRDMFTDADIIIFGHSHQSAKQFIRGCLMFNPGRARRSFGLLTIGQKIEAEIVSL